MTPTQRDVLDVVRAAGEHGITARDGAGRVLRALEDARLIERRDAPWQNRWVAR